MPSSRLNFRASSATGKSWSELSWERVMARRRPRKLACFRCSMVWMARSKAPGRPRMRSWASARPSMLTAMRRCRSRANKSPSIWRIRSASRALVEMVVVARGRYLRTAEMKSGSWGWRNGSPPLMLTVRRERGSLAIWSGVSRSRYLLRQTLHIVQRELQR